VSAVSPLIRARGLVKRFGSFTAVDGIDFDLQRGEAFGFLGPNGAGKSSTMRMIGCVSPPSAGELSILGLDPVRDGREIRARLGVVPQDDTLDVELTVRENLLIYGRYFGLPRDVIRERTAGLLSAAMAAKAFAPADARALAAVIVGIVLGLASQAYFEPGSIDLEASLAVATDAILALLIRHGPRAGVDRHAKR